MVEDKHPSLKGILKQTVHVEDVDTEEAGSESYQQLHMNAGRKCNRVRFKMHERYLMSPVKYINTAESPATLQQNRGNIEKDFTFHDSKSTSLRRHNTMTDLNNKSNMSALLGKLFICGYNQTHLKTIGN